MLKLKECDIQWMKYDNEMYYMYTIVDRRNHQDLIQILAIEKTTYETLLDTALTYDTVDILIRNNEMTIVLKKKRHNRHQMLCAVQRHGFIVESDLKISLTTDNLLNLFLFGSTRPIVRDAMQLL